MAARTAAKDLMTAFVPLVFLLFVRKGTTEEEIGSPLRVAQCRARCIQRFTTGGGASVQQSCIRGPRGNDCHMCWENCQLLQSNFAVWGAICDEFICFPGCKVACEFQKEAGGEQQRDPVIQTRGEEVIRVSAEGVASWPGAAPRGGGPLVYVVMRRVPGGGPWRQIVQTVEKSARLPPPQGPALRVLVVNREGLLTIYSPARGGAPPPGVGRSGLEAARGVLSTLGERPLARLGYPLDDLPPPPPRPPPPPAQHNGKRINTEILPTTHRSLVPLDESTVGENKSSHDVAVQGGDPGLSGRLEPWNLREVSLIHQKVLVIAEISWDPRGPVGPVYLVTWEVDGGGLTGNLLTDSTCVTLSLWPDTVYHIQVEVVRKDSSTERSEELVVDTGRAVAVEVVTEDGSSAEQGGPSGASRGDGPWAVAPAKGLSAELALGASAAVALFLFLVAVLLFHSARSRSAHHQKLSDVSPLHPSHRSICRVLGAPSLSLASSSSAACPTDNRQSSSGMSHSPPPHRTRTLHV